MPAFSKGLSFKIANLRSYFFFRLNSVVKKLRFRGGFGWMIGLTVKIKLRFEIPTLSQSPSRWQQILARGVCIRSLRFLLLSVAWEHAQLPQFLLGMWATPPRSPCKRLQMWHFSKEDLYRIHLPYLLGLVNPRITIYPIQGSTLPGYPEEKWHRYKNYII